MAVQSTAELSARQKAAIVVMTLGEQSQELLRQLGGVEVERLAEEIVQLGDVPDGIRDEVLAEFQNRLAATQTGGEGGLEKAAALLESALGKQQAEQVVGRMAWKANEQLKQFARKHPEKFAALCEPEHPQVTAFLLTQIEPAVCGKVLEQFDEETRSDLMWRIATMDEITPQAAAVVHRTINASLTPEAGEARKEVVGGEEKAANLLNMVEGEAQKAVFEVLEAKDPELAQRVRKLMFVFKDILLIDDRGIQRVLKEIESKQLVLALKDADPAIQNKIFKNMSERAAQTIQEEMEYLGPVKPSEVEEAKDAIIEQIRALEESGEIVVDRGGAA